MPKNRIAIKRERSRSPHRDTEFSAGGVLLEEISWKIKENWFASSKASDAAIAFQYPFQGSANFDLSGACANHWLTNGFDLG